MERSTSTNSSSVSAGTSDFGVTSRTVYLVVDSATAHIVARDKRIPGEPRDLSVSPLRSALPRGTGVELTVDDTALREGTEGRLVVASSAVPPDGIGRAFQPWHVDVEADSAQRWKGYLDPAYDLTLTNLVGATTPMELERLETPFVEARLLELHERPVPQTFDLDHLKGLHSRLFQDVYPWAGETRTVNMHRAGGPSFAGWEDLSSGIQDVANWVKDRGFLRGLQPEPFASGLAGVYNGLNAVHPFREGNGRTQRAWISDLSRAAGYQLDWSLVHGPRNDRISQLARTGDLGPLTQMIAQITTPVGGQATTPDLGSLDEATQARHDSAPGKSHLRLVPPSSGSSLDSRPLNQDRPYGQGPSRRR